MTTALLLRLGAPLQSWGTQSRFSERDTQLEPSKSGVVAILCAALGLGRAEPHVATPTIPKLELTHLAALTMAVRVDREGTKLRDFHTIGGGEAPDWFCEMHGMKRNREGRFNYGVSKANGNTPDTALSNRHYLSDARFLVALGAEDSTGAALLRECARALSEPVFPLFLGRKSFVPAEQVLHDAKEPLRSGASLPAILESEPWEPRGCDVLWNGRPRIDKLRLVVESTEDDGFPRADVPISFAKGDRRFATRYVKTDFTGKPIEEYLAKLPTSRKETVA